MRGKNHSSAARTKSRHLEKRRQKSRNAARYRREKENAIYAAFYELIPGGSADDSISHVDRIGSIRIAAAYCRTRAVAKHLFSSSLSLGSKSQSAESLEMELLECSDNFLLIVDDVGNVIYVSKAVGASIGLSQLDLVGCNFNDIVHTDDLSLLTAAYRKLYLSDELLKTEHVCCSDLINISRNKDEQVTVRLKSVLTARGRSLNLKSAIYKVVPFVVRSMPWLPHEIPMPPADDSVAAGAADFLQASPQSDALRLQMQCLSTNSSPCPASASPFFSETNRSARIPSFESTHDVSQRLRRYYLLYGQPLVYAASQEKLNEDCPLLTRHSLDMKFTFCHEKMAELLSFDAKSLVGTSFFKLIHPGDAEVVARQLKQLHVFGQIVLGFYRVLVKGGGFRWFQTECSFISAGCRSSRGQYIVCTHQLASSANVAEMSDVVFATMQLSSSVFSLREPAKAASAGSVRRGRSSIQSVAGTVANKASCWKTASLPAPQLQKPASVCIAMALAPSISSDYVATNDISTATCKDGSNKRGKRPRSITAPKREGCAASVSSRSPLSSSTKTEQLLGALPLPSQASVAKEIKNTRENNDSQSNNTNNSGGSVNANNNYLYEWSRGQQSSAAKKESSGPSGIDLAKVPDLAYLAPFVSQEDLFDNIPLEPLDLDFDLGAFDFPSDILAEIIGQSSSQCVVNNTETSASFGRMQVQPPSRQSCSSTRSADHRCVSTTAVAAEDLSQNSGPGHLSQLPVTSGQVCFPYGCGQRQSQIAFSKNESLASPAGNSASFASPSCFNQSHPFYHCQRICEAFRYPFGTVANSAAVSDCNGSSGSLSSASPNFPLMPTIRQSRAEPL